MICDCGRENSIKHTVMSVYMSLSNDYRSQSEWTQDRNLFNSKPISKKFQHYSLSFHDWFLFRSKRNNLVPDVKVTINVRMKTVLPTSIAFIYFRFVFSHEEITPINLLQAVSLIKNKKRQEVTRSVKNRQEVIKSDKNGKKKKATRTIK